MGAKTVKTVLITGAGRGIGFHLAHRMAEIGWHVISAVHTLDSVEGDLPSTVIEMDVASDDSVQSASKQVTDLDVLINNAIFKDLAMDTDALTVPLDLVMKSLDVNTAGPLRVARAFVPALLRSPDGRIVNVSSISGQLADVDKPKVGYPAYRISKAGLNMVTGILSYALLGKIPVNSVCPSGGRTMADAVEEIVWAATELDRDQTGKFLHNRKPIVW